MGEKFTEQDLVTIDGKQTILQHRYQGTIWVVFPPIYGRRYWPEADMTKVGISDRWKKVEG